MQRYVLCRAAIWAASLFGAVVATALIAAIAAPADGGYPAAVFARLSRVVAFDFGVSSLNGANASSVALVALQRSLAAFLPAIPIALVFGVLSGALLAWRKSYYLVAPLAGALRSVPIFCAALFAAIVFAPNSLVGGVAADAAQSDFLFASDRLARLAPLIWIIGLVGAGSVGFAVSDAVRKALAEPYAAGLARLGLPHAEIVRGHVARQVLGMTLKDGDKILLALYSATVVVEWVFNWPGAGSVFVRSVALGDWSVVSAIVLVLVTLRITVELICLLGARAILGMEPAS